MMAKFFEGIEIRLDVRDTRVMRPDTLGESIDDAIGLIGFDLMKALYRDVNRTGPIIHGLREWVP